MGRFQRAPHRNWIFNDWWHDINEPLEGKKRGKKGGIRDDGDKEKMRDETFHLKNARIWKESSFETFWNDSEEEEELKKRVWEYIRKTD